MNIRGQQWRSHGSRTCTDRFTESQAPVFGLGTVLWPSALVLFYLAYLAVAKVSTFTFSGDQLLF